MTINIIENGQNWFNQINNDKQYTGILGYTIEDEILLYIGLTFLIALYITKFVNKRKEY